MIRTESRDEIEICVETLLLGLYSSLTMQATQYDQLLGHDPTRPAENIEACAELFQQILSHHVLLQLDHKVEPEAAIGFRPFIPL